MELQQTHNSQNNSKNRKKSVSHPILNSQTYYRAAKNNRASPVLRQTNKPMEQN